MPAALPAPADCRTSTATALSEAAATVASSTLAKPVTPGTPARRRVPRTFGAGTVADAGAAWQALQARDARFDGHLFVGVTSTGVYCRPVCRVRTPKPANCRFFHTPAQAEAARFRPCLKCRPEIAPGLSAMDSSQNLAEHAARWLSAAVHAGEPVRLPALAARLGITDRHLRRIFQATHRVSARDFVATQRLLLAKQLLTDTAQPVAQVALASGFDSLRRFNAAFAERYRLNPTALRRAHAEAPAAGRAAATPAGDPSPGPVLRLAWRPPFDTEALLGHFARRALPGLEVVQGLTLRRTLAWPHRGQRLRGWIELRLDPARAEVQMRCAPELAPVLGALCQRVRHALDLDANPVLIDPVLAQLPLPPRPGLRLPGAFDGFEAAVRVVLGQQVTVQAARTLTQRLVQWLGEPLITPYADLDRLFPSAQAVADASPQALGRLGIIRQRVRALQALACELAGGRLCLDPGAALAPTLDALRALPGIGEWTAQVLAMRALGWPDAWPASDVGLMKVLGTRDARQITAQGEAWRPWRAYAVMRLWHAVETQETV